MAEPIFNVVDDAVFRFTPTGEDEGVNEIIMTKEIFIECYERWIKESEGKE